tara:strand:+ start:1667 stop:3991 length:2325 start_codon:yes stop_codon:yes gene_type:complete
MASKAIGFLNFKFSADLTSFERAMNKAQKKLKKFGKSMQRIGKNMSQNLTMPILALGAVSLKTFADFEQSMLKVKAVSGATDKNFKLLTESAKKLGSSTMFTASQVATLQFELSKLGFNPKEILASTEAILQLAQATDTELGEAAKTTAVALNSFNAEASEAQRFADIMALASSSAAMDMEKFAAALPVVGATSRLAGDSFEELSAKLQVLADSGMEGGSMGTHLNKIYSKLAKSGSTWDEGMQKLIDSNFDMVLAQEMFGDRAFKSALILAENIDKTKKYTIANKEASGIAKEMADIMDSGVGGAMRRMKSQLEGVAIELGQQLIPIFTKVIKKVEQAVKWFSDLSDEQKKSIVKWGLILAAVGPVLIIIGKMSIGLGALVGALKTVGTLIITNPYMAFAAAIGVVAISLTDWADGLFGVSGAQKAVNDINSTAAKAISRQKSDVDLLTMALKDENTTLEEKETALKQLNKISPEYYGKLNAAALDVGALDVATQNYTESILHQARAEASKAKLAELNAVLLEFELNGIKKGSKVYNLMTAKTQLQIKAVMDLIGENKKIGESLAGLDDEKEIIEDLTTEINGLGSSLGKILDGDKIEMFSSVEDQFKGLVVWTKELTTSQKLLNASMGMFGDIVTSSLTEALNSGDNFFQVFLDGIKKAIRALLIQLAVMTAIQMLMGKVPVGGLKAALTSNLGEIMNVQLAEGGIVTGPTTALIGEGAGTSISNPEVVAPLDKLKQYMGGGSQNVVVTGKIVGNDIWLSNEKTQFNRQRTT